jgi:peptidoglycan/xylan/chitin deacetylase (PgdA/CDA1 family)
MKFRYVNSPEKLVYKAFKICTLLFLITLSTANAGETLFDVRSEKNPLKMREYKQTFTVTYDSEESATNAKLVKEQLPDGKKWAFSARWDDNNKASLKMRKLMNKYGFKGTFYLTASKKQFGAEYANSLMKDGFSIGGHTMTHPDLTKLTMDKIFWEIAAIKVERESETNYPINSFAFSFGRFASKEDPEMHKSVAESLFRAGYHHNVYSWFIKKEAGIPKNAISSALQVLPGDKNTSVEAFDKWVDKFNKAAWYNNLYKNMSVGIHVWHKGKDWDVLEECFKKYANRPDWWYCNQNEYAAYRYQFHNSKIAKLKQNGKEVVYEITRQYPIDLGDMYPLSVSGKNITAVNGKNIEHGLKSVGDKSHIILNHNKDKALPVAIDRIENKTNQQKITKAHASRDFTGLSTLLFYNEANNKMTLTIENQTDTNLKNVEFSLRLPLAYKTGQLHFTLKDIKAGEKNKKSFELPEMSKNGKYSNGSLYFMGQLDFRTNKQNGRIYTTVTLNKSGNKVIKYVPKKAVEVKGNLIENGAFNLYEGETSWAKGWKKTKRASIKIENDNSWLVVEKKKLKSGGVALVQQVELKPEWRSITLKARVRVTDVKQGEKPYHNARTLITFKGADGKRVGNWPRVFSTAADNQPSVDIHVLQGERDMAGHNKSIGRFRLDGIAPAPRGVPQIEVAFDIDANGILHVTAKDTGTGKEQKITISADSGLSDEEVEKMVKDAEAHADEDKEAKDAVETKNKADSMIYQTEKQLKEHEEKLSDEIKQPVIDGLEKLKKNLEADDVEAMKTTMAEIEEHIMKFGEEIYKQAGAEAGAEAPGAGGCGADCGDTCEGHDEPKEKVVDAEVIDED